MPHGVHAAVDHVQPSCADAMVDGGNAQAEAAQLRSRHDAVLRPRERSEGPVCGDLTAHIAV
jgi:hypothetical protein